MSNLAVVIPSRTLSNMKPCVEAVQKHEPEAQIFVVDDGIVDRPVPSQGMMYINGISPFCFARNCNLGILMAHDRDVVLLNDDALLETPGGFSLMQGVAEENPSIGVISSTTNVAGNLNQQPKGVGLRFELHRSIAFVCVLIPRRTILLLGGLDERFGGTLPDGRRIYGWEDNDYVRRVRSAGLRVAIHDGCYVDHGSLRSTFRGDPRSAGDISAGAEVYRAKWGDLK
jgi:GT2 family glycosyltransferase